jgi:Holliday junction resolvase
MSSASKAKGSAWERAVVSYLIDNGWPYAERRLAGDTHDRGDIAGVVSVVLECKSEKRIDLAGYMKELAIEMANDKATMGAAVVKKRGTTSAGDAYAVLPFELFCQLLKQAGY